jgi:hypothetical protein
MATAKLKRKPRLSKIESLKAKEARLNLVSAQKLASSYNIYIALLCSSLVARRSSLVGLQTLPKRRGALRLLRLRLRRCGYTARLRRLAAPLAPAAPAPR